MNSDVEPPASKSSDDIVVFIIRRDTKCAECGEELGKGRWLRLENERPLCLACADLDHLDNDRAQARAAVRSDIDRVLARWQPEAPAG
jgi:hypothetical protein